MSADGKTEVRRLGSLKAHRQPFEAAWQECMDYTWPERGYGLNGTALNSFDVQTKKNRILDDTAADSGRILASSCVSGTTPANSIWVGLDSGSENEEDDDADRWLDDASRVLFENIHGANFDAVNFECMIDMVGAGWFVLYIYEAKEGGYHFEQWPFAQCFISSSKPGGLVDTIYREHELTVEQVVEQYGLDKVSEKVKASYAAEKYDEKVAVCHSIKPRKIHVPGARLAKNLPFESIHTEISSNHVLRESGYHEFPCAVPRWMLIPGTSYATGAVSTALGSIRTINDIKALELANLDLATAGMWIAEDDGVLNPRTVKVGPRKIVVANSVDSMKALTPGANFNVAFSAEDRLQAAIRKILLADQLQPQNGPAMTATEIHMRVQLIRQLLGPIYGRLQAEYLQPLITRCFGLAYRAGILGEAPESLKGKSLSIQYFSPLARAQKMEEVQAIDQYVAGAVAVSEVHPEVLDTIDFDAAQKVKAEALGVPSKVIPSDKDIAKKRAEREAKAKQAQQQQMQQEVISKATPAIAQQAIAA